MFYKVLTVLCLVSFSATAQHEEFSIKENYRKIDTMIAMRDGIKLYTVIYIPKDESQKYPFLMERTPYSSGPYGTIIKRSYRTKHATRKEKYIFVYQDVRGRYMSEGHNLEVTPYIPIKKIKHGCR